jgi:hypothetical protein
MSSAEDIFGSSGFADEFAGIEAAALTDFWREEAVERAQLFAKVRSQLGHIQATFTEGDRTNWQSFHRFPYFEGTTNLWITRKVGIGLTDDQTRVISCWDGHENVRYAEYVISGKHDLSGSKTGEARMDPDAKGWTPEMLGSCALIQFSADNKVNLFRGNTNYVVAPTNCDRSYEELGKRLETSRLIKRELTDLAQVLAGLSMGTYEEGAEGELK